MNLSNSGKVKVNATNSIDPMVILLQIDHPDLAAPIRVVQDSQNITSNGNLYVKMPFDVTPPDDLTQGSPKATLKMDNVGRELMQWLEISNGGAGATATLSRVFVSNPDIVEWQVTMDMTNLVANTTTVSARLGYEDLLNRAAVPIRYTPETAPGIF